MFALTNKKSYCLAFFFISLNLFCFFLEGTSAEVSAIDNEDRTSNEETEKNNSVQAIARNLMVTKSSPASLARVTDKLRQCLPSLQNLKDTSSKALAVSLSAATYLYNNGQRVLKNLSLRPVKKYLTERDSIKQQDMLLVSLLIGLSSLTCDLTWLGYTLALTFSWIFSFIYRLQEAQKEGRLGNVFNHLGRALDIPAITLVFPLFSFLTLWVPEYFVCENYKIAISTLLYFFFCGNRQIIFRDNAESLLKFMQSTLANIESATSADATENAKDKNGDENDETNKDD